MIRLKSIRALFVVGLFLMTPLFSHAQLSQSDTSAAIRVTPAYPEPNTSVTLTLEAYTYNQNGSSISWYIDGIEDVGKKNQREVELIVGDYTDATEVIARLTLADGTAIDIKRSIMPTRIDIVLEADTLVPLFYKGRALPSAGSVIRAVAIPVSRHTPSELTYTWRLNNKSLHKGPLRGQDTAEFELLYGGEATISVEVADPNGVVFAKKIVQVNTVEPEMYFYETNVLRGLSRHALFSPHQLIGNETTVRAEPYYMDKHILEKDVHMEWKINGSTVENPSSDPQNITLRNNGGTGSFKIEFHIRNLENLLQGIREDFTLTF